MYILIKVLNCTKATQYSRMASVLHTSSHNAHKEEKCYRDNNKRAKSVIINTHTKNTITP